MHAQRDRARAGQNRPDTYARAEMSEFALFRKLLARLKFYIGFEIQDQTGEALSDAQISARHFRRLHT